METLEFADWTLLLHVATTFALVGLIGFVQVVHYPLMARVPREGFRRYELDHQRLTTWIVLPLMATELFSAVLLFWYRPEAVDSIAVWLGFCCSSRFGWRLIPSRSRNMHRWFCLMIRWCIADWCGAIGFEPSRGRRGA